MIETIADISSYSSKRLWAFLNCYRSENKAINYAGPSNVEKAVGSMRKLKANP